MSSPTNEEFSHGKHLKFFRLVELLRLTFFSVKITTSEEHGDADGVCDFFKTILLMRF